ncbi:MULTISPECIES: DUF317 domain-containing protein [unclassified Streptomyces]|uniref:DUF317 domain-containing protein n=1 Tax=unclassified Streptomyces TaxID=2593676 RepID=UPI00403CF0F0
MSTTSADVHVRFDTHPAHPSAVTAHLAESLPDSARGLLADRGFVLLDEHTMVLARIDHEEPYWAHQAAQKLTAQGITTTITPRLREAIAEEWTWAGHPMSWLTRSEIRAVSDEAQKIHDDIRHGRLIIHAHADDHGTTVAAGTYRDTGTSVYLHGENHLRCVADTFDSITTALTAFEHAHHTTLRPGPAPMTDTERQTAQARVSLQAPQTPSATSEPVTEEVPAYAADTGDHDALLNTFLNTHRDWERWRTWSDETTYAIHESQTLRIERVHEAPAHETAWTVAAYETPVSDRMWVLTSTGATPAPVLEELLDHLADGDGWDTAPGTPVDEKMITAATQPLSNAGWTHTVEGRWIRWTSPTGDAGVQFDAFTAQHPTQNLATWTIWAGPGAHRPTWALTASPSTPSSLLASLSETVAHGVGPRQRHPEPTAHVDHRATPLPSNRPLQPPAPRRR